MANNLIATTPKISMHALAFQGIMVYTCFPQIRDMLRRKFGDDYVLLFAEPVENVKDGKIDWYSPVQGEARPLSSLPAEESAPAYNQISHMADEILKYAEELIRTGEPLKITRGNILKLALNYPDDNAIYMVGGQPVFTCWGFGPGTPGAESKILTRLGAPVKAAAPEARENPVPNKPVEEQKTVYQEPPVQNQTKAPIGWAWLWWLWPLAAACLLFLLLFSSFGHIPALSGLSLFHFPALPFDSGIDAYADQIREEESAVLSLRDRVEQHANLCVREPVAEKKAPEIPKNAEQLIIPKNAEDTAFLEGLWHCETGLANAKTGEPVKVTFEFDKNGGGTATIYEQRGQCKGPAKAALHNGQLHIAVEEQVCPGTGSYNAVVIDCESATNGATLCKGTNQDGSRWDATFLKLK